MSGDRAIRILYLGPEDRKAAIEENRKDTGETCYTGEKKRGFELLDPPDKCPPIGSPEFAKKFPVEENEEYYRLRILAAAANGYGD